MKGGVKKILCLLLCVLSLILTGCWDSKELNEIAIVSAVALDETVDGQILMSLLITNPSKISGTGTGSGSGQESNNGQASIILSEKGNGILDAYHKIQAKVPRDIYFSQIKDIVISEKLARKGVNGILDFFTRYRESHLRAEVVFTKNQAVNLFKINTEYEKLPSDSIRKKTKLVLGAKSTLLTFFNSISEDGIEAQAPEFETGPFETENQNKSTEEKKIGVVFKGTAVFKSDKLIGFLDDQKIKGVVNLSGTTKGGTISIIIPKENGGGFVSIRIPRSDTNINPVIKGDNIAADVHIKLEGRIFENESKLDLSDPKTIHYIETLTQNTLTQEIKPLLYNVQKDYNSDIYGFGAAFHRKYKDIWDSKLNADWDKIFPNLSINLNCDISIARVGFLTKSLGINDNELIK